MGEKLRKTGITVLGDVPWGTHLCLFYQTKEDLIDILVPYFKAGLENNELCMWVTSEPLKVDEAKTALKKAVKNLDNYIKKGQIEILDASQWYTKTGKFKSAKVLEGWVAKEKQALEKGFDGLRLTGNTFWLEKRDWENFTDYEKGVDSVIHKHQMIALCSYSLDKCGASEIIDVVDNHQSALIKRRGKWELLERGKCKRAEEARKESEEKFRNLAEQSPNMIFINKKGRVVYANQKCEEIMGYKREEFYSSDFNFLTLMAPESLDLAKASFSKHIKGEDVAPYECTLITKKGKRVTAIITTKLIQYNGDNAILGMLTDITERKQTEEALKTSEALYRDLVEKAGIGIIIEDKDGNLKYFNEKFAELFGYSVAEIKKLSNPNQTLVYPADNEKILKIWKKRIQGKRVPSRYEFRGIRKDGTIRYFEIDVVNLNAEGKYSGIRAYIRDITERKQAVETLKISEENYKTIFENLPFVGLTFDRKGRLLEANKRAEEVTGLSLKDFKGKSFSKFGLLGKKDLFIAFTEFRKNLQGRVTDGTIYHPKLKDGREILLELVGIPIKENGEVKSVLVVGDDVTERKRAVEALKVSEQKYKSLVKNLSVGVYRNTPGPKGKFIEVNPAIVKMFGYDSREEFLKLNVLQLYQNPGARKEFNKKMKKDGLVKNAEIKLKRKDGTPFLGSVTAVAIRDGKGKINHYDGIIEDITEQKRAAEELKYMHKIYRKTIENAQGVPYRLNYADNTYEFIGEGCEELLGIPPKELTFEKLRNMVKQIVVTDPKAPSDPFKYVRAFRRGKVKRYQADLQIVTPSGDTKWVSDCSVPILDEKKESVIGSLGILQDITERKRAEEALTEANVRLQMLQQVTTAVHSTLDLENIFKQITNGIVHSLGYTTASVLLLNDEKNYFETRGFSTKKQLLPQIDKILGVPLRHFAVPADPELNPYIEAAMKGKVVVVKRLAEILYPLANEKACTALQRLGRTKNYIVVPIEVEKEVVGAVVITSPREKVSKEELRTVKAFVHTASNGIKNAKLHVQVKQAEEALRIKDSAIASSINAMAMADLDGHLTYVNDAFLKMWGYAKSEEVLGKPAVKFWQLEKEAFEVVKALRDKGSWVGELVARRKDGSLFYAQLSASMVRYETSRPICMMASFIDVTERKHMEETLRESEERFRFMAETTGDVLYRLRYDTMTFDYLSPAISKLTGYSAAEINELGFASLLERVVVGGAAGLSLDELARRRMQGKTGEWHADYQLRTKTGELRWISDHSVPWKDDSGKIIGAVGILQDITERKHMEEALRESEERYRITFESTGTATVIIEEDTTLSLVNSEFEKLSGYSKEEIEGKMSWTTFVAKEDLDRMKEYHRMRRIDASAAPSGYEFRFIDRQGNVRDILLNIAMIPRTKKSIASLLDITERKQTQRALQESEEKYRTQFEEALDAIFVADAETGIIIDCNRAASNLVGREKSELVGKHQRILHPPEEIEGKFSRTFKQHLKEKEGQVLETQVITKKGAIKDVAIKGSIFELKGEKLIQGTFRDITERKKAEEEVVRLSSAVKISTDSIVISNLEGKIIDVNEATLKMYGAADKRDLIGKSSFDLITPEDRRRALEGMKEVLESGYIKNREYHIITKDGSRLPVEMNVALMKDADGKPIGFVGISRDITERKLAEEKIKVSLKEKEALLKEIHHRVKNNMQVISSLLNLQSEQIKDKQSLEMFRDSQNRVKSMALIHEKLYRSKDLARIDFAEYVQSLTNHLFNSYGINRAIKLETNIKGVLLDINTAIPCGLIINELVSNSLKHAFLNGTGGPSGTEWRENKISISMNSDKKDKYTLIVSDNGVGFPKDLASRIQDTNTLGLKLVNTLVEQLDGSIELGNSLPSDSRRENGGAVFKITFEKQKYAKKS